MALVDYSPVAAAPVHEKRGNFFSNFWDAMTHPFSMLSGAVKSQFENPENTKNWSSEDWIHYGRTGEVPITGSSATSVGQDSIAPGSNTPGSSYDPTGTDQANWDLEKTRELLAEQREYNSAEAAKNREWQERMSNSAYQRAVQDIEAAGLNKWLAVTGGNGASASTPSGSTATSSAGDASTPNPQLAKAIIQAIASLGTSAMKIISKLG